MVKKCFVTGFHGNYDVQNKVQTILGIMVKYSKGGPKFLFKMIPVARLEACFFYENASYIVDVIKQLNGLVIAIVCDNKGTNQSF